MQEASSCQDFRHEAMPTLCRKCFTLWNGPHSSSAPSTGNLATAWCHRHSWIKSLHKNLNWKIDVQIPPGLKKSSMLGDHGLSTVPHPTLKDCCKDKMEGLNIGFTLQRKGVIQTPVMWFSIILRKAEQKSNCCAIINTTKYHPLHLKHIQHTCLPPQRILGTIDC